MADLVDGFCHRCGKPVGKVSWDAADFVFHPACQKAEEVYTPPEPPLSVRLARLDHDLIAKLERERRAGG